MSPFFDSKGNLVSGAKVAGGGAGATTVSVVQTEVDAAVERCKQGASARNEMLALFNKYPMLREDRWQVFEHPLSPLVDAFVKQMFG